MKVINIVSALSLMTLCCVHVLEAVEENRLGLIGVAKSNIGQKDQWGFLSHYCEPLYVTLADSRYGALENCSSIDGRLSENLYKGVNLGVGEKKQSHFVPIYSFDALNFSSKDCSVNCDFKGHSLMLIEEPVFEFIYSNNKELIAGKDLNFYVEGNGSVVIYSNNILPMKTFLRDNKGKIALEIFSENNIGAEFGSLYLQGGILKVKNHVDFSNTPVELSKSSKIFIEPGKNLSIANLSIKSDQPILVLDVLGSGTLNVENLIVPAGNLCKIEGCISSADRLTKKGLGTLSLQGTYNAKTILVEQGRLCVTPLANSANAAIDLKHQAEFEVMDGSCVQSPIFIDGQCFVLVDKGTASFEAPVTGSSGLLVKKGPGILNLKSQTNSVKAYDIQEGTIVFSPQSNLKTSPIYLSGGGICIEGKQTISAPVKVESYGFFDTTLNSITFVNRLSGSGIIHKKGEGTLIFSADSNFLGSLQVDRGLVGFSSSGRINLQDLSGNGGKVRVDCDQTVVVNQKNPKQFAGNIEGSGHVIVKGEKPLTLLGAVQPTLTVESGALFIEESAKNVLVQKDGILSGSGSICNANIAGILSPSINQNVMNIDCLSFEPNSVLEIAISKSGASSIQVLQVEGLKNAQLKVSTEHNELAQGQQWKILSSNSALSDQFEKNLQSPENFVFDVSYQENDIFLTLSQVITSDARASMKQSEPIFAQFPAILTMPALQTINQINNTISTAGLSGNQKKIAQYLNEQNPQVLGDSFSHLTALSGKQLSKALNTISDSRLSFSAFTIQNLAISLSEMITSRFADQRSMRYPKENPLFSSKLDNYDDLIAGFLPQRSKPKKVEPSSKPMTFYVMGLGNFASQDEQNQDPRFSMNSAAVLAGFDYGNKQQGLVGCAAAYTYSHISENGNFGSANINSGYISAYGTYYVGDFYLDAQLWSGYQSTSNTRDIFYSTISGKAHSSHGSWSLNPHLGLGYDFFVTNSPNYVIEPFVGFDWVNLFEGSYKEHGSTVYNMNVNSRYSSMFQMELGCNQFFNCQFESGSLVSKLMLSYILKTPCRTGSIQTSLVGGTGNLYLSAFTDVQNLASPSFEILWNDKNGFYGSLGYKGEFGSGYISNQVLTKLGVKF